jgi:hypothetical protein
VKVNSSSKPKASTKTSNGTASATRTASAATVSSRDKWRRGAKIFGGRKGEKQEAVSLLVPVLQEQRLFISGYQENSYGYRKPTSRFVRQIDANYVTPG